jgi:hypothetical protein
MGPAHCRNRNPGPVFWLWTVFCDLPSRQIKSASGSIATNDVHYSGASAADFHRLPDAPRVVGKIRFFFLKASFTDFAAVAAEVGEPRRLVERFRRARL